MHELPHHPAIDLQALRGRFCGQTAPRECRRAFVILVGRCPPALPGATLTAARAAGEDFTKLEDATRSVFEMITRNGMGIRGLASVGCPRL